jgi:hypothetical protein
LGLIVGEDAEYVLNPLLVALPKRRIGLVFWVVVGDSLNKEKMAQTLPIGNFE